MSEKTIRMPKELLAKWLAALRSGRVGDKPIIQTMSKLHDGKGGYCCLGVLQVCAAGRVSRDDDNDEIPSLKWLQRYGIQFVGGAGQDPRLPTLQHLTAAEANDSGHTFAEIADAIEACAEAT